MFVFAVVLAAVWLVVYLRMRGCLYAPFYIFGNVVLLLLLGWGVVLGHWLPASGGCLDLRPLVWGALPLSGYSVMNLLLAKRFARRLSNP